MTATIERIDWDVLEVITNRILAEVDNVNRVCYDMSPNHQLPLSLNSKQVEPESRIKQRTFAFSVWRDYLLIPKHSEDFIYPRLLIISLLNLQHGYILCILYFLSRLLRWCFYL